MLTQVSYQSYQRYDPRDITTILVYRREHDREVFLAKAHAQSPNPEQLPIEAAPQRKWLERICQHLIYSRLNPDKT